MKKTIQVLFFATAVSALAFTQGALAAKGPQYCASWESGQPVKLCEWKGGTKTVRIGSAHADYGTKWTSAADQSSGVECSPEALGGNPFEGTGYSGRLDCYYE